MVLGKLLANHYEEETLRTQRVQGSRAVIPRERKFVDATMRQVNMVGGPLKGSESAWQGMTYAPYEEAPKIQRRIVPIITTTTEKPFDSEAEARRLSERRDALAKWEQGDCSALPTTEFEPPPQRPSEPTETPFATGENQILEPIVRGRRRLEPQHKEKAEHLGRRRIECRAAGSTIDQDNDALCAAVLRSDSTSAEIRNPLAASFLIRNRPTTRVIQQKDDMAAVLAEKAEYQPKFARRAFPEQTGGGASCLSIDDGALSAALPTTTTAKRSIKIQRKPDEPVRPGRRQFKQKTAETLAPSVDSLEHFATWYRQTYGDEPPRAALERAAQDIVDRQLLLPTEDDDDGPEVKTPPHPSVAPPGDADAFVRWYEAKYQTAPPPNLVQRAAKTMALGDKIQPPKKDPLQQHSRRQPPQPQPHHMARSSSSKYY